MSQKSAAWILLLTAKGAGVQIRRQIRLLDIKEVCLYGGLASYPFLYICSTVNWADLWFGSQLPQLTKWVGEPNL